MWASFIGRILAAAFPSLLFAHSGFAHLSYTGRSFGSFTGLELQTVTITGQSVPNNWGWADGTDADFAHSHYLRFFRFTLEITSSVTISVTSLDPSAMLPGFSIYSGLAHTSPLDYETDLTFQYLATLPGPTKEGAFNAMATWRMGNDSSVSYDDFSTFTYVGHAADGTPANYGNSPGVNGDNTPDGTVSSTFVLGPGSYTLAVGGSNYGGQETDSIADPVTVAVTVVPEPTAGILAVAGLIFVSTFRRLRISRS